MVSSETSGDLFLWIDIASQAIQVLAIAIIVVAVFIGTARYLYYLLGRRGLNDSIYLQYKHGIARALLLGLEILVAADVIRTVALEPTLESIAALGLLVLVRTFLSWSLVVEIEGRWPWQRSRDSEI